MADLEKLHKTYKDARLRYLNVRRDAEEALIAELVDRLNDQNKRLILLEAERLLTMSGPEFSEEMHTVKDRMAAARAAKAAKRDTGLSPPDAA